MATRIAILNCYDIRHSLFNFHGRNVDEAELLSARVESFSRVKTEMFNIYHDEFPEEDYDAYIISGSHFNPDRHSITKHAWMRNLLSFIRQTHQNRIPILGICFGHQMISVALGAKVFELVEFESGYRKVVIDERHHTPLFNDVPKEFYGAFFHKWAVYSSSIPFGSKLLAKSPDVPDQATAFCKGETTFAVQFHPERVARDVKIMTHLHPDTSYNARKVPHRISSDANVQVLKNYVTWVAKRK